MRAGPGPSPVLPTVLSYILLYGHRFKTDIDVCLTKNSSVLSNTKPKATQYKLCSTQTIFIEYEIRGIKLTKTIFMFTVFLNDV